MQVGARNYAFLSVGHNAMRVGKRLPTIDIHSPKLLGRRITHTVDNLYTHALYFRVVRHLRLLGIRSDSLRRVLKLLPTAN